MKILMSGGNGKFAQAFIKANQDHNIFAPKKKTMDVTKISAIEEAILNYNPDIFLHAGAFTRPMAKHEEFPEISIKSNIIGTSNVAVVCIKHKIKLIYISTDYVYPGTDGNYEENDALLPFNKYGWSKMGGE